MPVTQPTARARAGWWAVLLVVCALAAVGVAGRTWPLIVGTALGSRGESLIPPDDGPLPGRAVPILDSPHIPVGKAGSVRYDSVPPTSGPHFAVPPATGIYTRPLPAGLQVHALEHGHVGIQYASDTPAGVVAEIRQLGGRYPDDVFVAPYPALGHGIALTAWGRIDRFDRWDPARVTRFVEQLRGRYDHGWAGHRAE